MYLKGWGVLENRLLVSVLSFADFTPYEQTSDEWMPPVPKNTTHNAHPLYLLCGISGLLESVSVCERAFVCRYFGLACNWRENLWMLFAVSL